MTPVLEGFLFTTLFAFLLRGVIFNIPIGPIHAKTANFIRRVVGHS